MDINICSCPEEFYYGVYNLIKMIYPNSFILRDGKENYDITFSFEFHNDFVVIKMNDNKIKVDINLISIKKAIYRLTDASLDFGILTGVRPSKIGLKCNSYEEISNIYLVDVKKAKIIKQCADVEKKLIATIPKKSIALYINIPFCPTRCKYCSFTIGGIKDYKLIIDDYFKALIFDLEETLAILDELDIYVYSVYIGGGTPTVLDLKYLDILTGIIAKKCKNTKEFTVEAGRPDTINTQNLKILKNNSVTRISINPQSLNQSTLDLAGRKHSVSYFYNAYNNAILSGFKNINCDMIAGFENEEFSDFKWTIDELIKLSPNNLTVHTMCQKKNSQNHIENRLIFNNEVKKMLEYSYEITKDVYEPYYIYRQKNAIGSLENIGFSKKNAICVYNIIMMEEIASVVSVGAGGVSKLIGFADKKPFLRLRCDKQPETYISEIKNIINKKRKFLYEGHNFI